MIDKTWLNLAAERGIALATWGLYPSDRRPGKHAVDREAVAGRRLRQLAAENGESPPPLAVWSLSAHTTLDLAAEQG